MNLALIPNKKNFERHADWEEAVLKWMGVEKIQNEEGRIIDTAIPFQICLEADDVIKA